MSTEALHWAIDKVPPIGVSAFAVLVALAHRTPINHHQVEVTVDQLAAMTALSNRGVKRALTLLNEAGFVHSVRTGRANVYRLAFDPATRAS